LILKGEIRMLKVGTHFFIERDSINHFFETRWNKYKESIREEILNYKNTLNQQKDLHKGKTGSGDPVQKLYNEMLNLFMDITSSTNKESEEFEGSPTPDPEKIKRKIVSSSKFFSDAYKTFIEMIAEIRHKNH
jgi:hypothetical protein